MHIYFFLLFILNFIGHTQSSSWTSYFTSPINRLYDFIWPTCHTVTFNDLNRLSYIIKENVIGQPIATQYVDWAIDSHFRDDNPRRALSIVLMGTTGTGKTFISSLVQSVVFGNDAKEVKKFIGRVNFPKVSLLETYQSELTDIVQKQLKLCPRSIFIFDEVDKMIPGLLDALKPCLDYHNSFDGVDCRKAVFFFLTNVGGEKITAKYRDLIKEGYTRNTMRYQNFEPLLRQLLFKTEGMFESAVISDQLISLYLPFLPLTKKEVLLCIQSALKENHLFTSTNVDYIVNMLEFDELDGISYAGCKRVYDLVQILKARTNKRNEL